MEMLKCTEVLLWFVIMSLMSRTMSFLCYQVNYVTSKCLYIYIFSQYDWIKMTSSNGNTFCVTGHLWGNSRVTSEFPAQRPVTQSFDVFFDLRLNKRLRKQWRSWWFETPSRPLWRHCNDGGRLICPEGRVSSLNKSNPTNCNDGFSLFPGFSLLTCVGQCVFVLSLKHVSAQYTFLVVSSDIPALVQIIVRRHQVSNNL